MHAGHKASEGREHRQLTDHTRFSRVSARAGSATGARIKVADHELLGIIGRGSYGEVWLARSVLGGLRAVKLIYRNRFTDQRPFEREFEGIQRFEPISRSHPSLLAILHVGKNEEAGCFYYVMELADAAAPQVTDDHDAVSPDPAIGLETQASLLAPGNSDPCSEVTSYRPHTLRYCLEQRGRLPIAECVQIGLSLTTALSHLHQNGLVHRDIKPSNVIFVNGVPKFADLGLVTEAGDTQSIVGTEGYLPPEGPGRQQADIYSLGKVLYEISTGTDRRLYPELPADLRESAECGAMVEFNEILLKACAKNPARRYRSAAEMGDDLALLHAGKSVKRRHAWKLGFSYAGKVVLAMSVLASAVVVLSTLRVWKLSLSGVQWSKNEAANEAYRNGLLAFRAGSGNALSQSAKHFERAIELDAKFADAYARLAQAYSWQGPGDLKMLKQARSMAEKALALDDKLDEAHREIGWCKALLDHDWAGAEREYKLAIHLNPSSEANLYGYATFLVVAGRTREAVRLVEKAIRLDPRSILYLQNAGWVFSAAREYDRAIQEFEEMIEQEPSSRVRVAGLLATAYREQGDYLKAIQLEEEAALLKGENADQVKTRFDTFRDAYRRGRQKAYWEQELEWSQNDETNPERLAALYARVGNPHKAFYYLNLAYERTPTQLTFQINRDPSLDSLRAQRPFADVLKKLGLGR